MNSILNNYLLSDNPELVITLLSIAVFRIYLEVIGFDINNLPVTKLLAKRDGGQGMAKFHKMGLVFSIGYILLFAPTLLLS